jgi:hypothetical protein
MTGNREVAVPPDRPCDLCSLPVGVAPYQVLTTEGSKFFCCEGCEGIYRILHEELIVEQGEGF